MNTEKIIEDLKKYDELYFEFGTSPITDTDYDLLKTKAKELFPNHEYFKQVGFKSSYKKIKLPFIMGGLDKVDIESVTEWISKKEDEIVVSEKLDGNSILVTWEKGKVVFAASRGDENEGQDILKKAIYFIPEIPIKEKITLRGEVVLEDNLHEKLGFKNRRNGVTGLLRRDEIKPDDLKLLSVIFYEVIESPEQINTEMERLDYIFYELGLRIPFHIIMLNNHNISADLSGFLFYVKEKSSYDIDGLVLTYNHSERENVSYPKNKVKFKVNEQSKKCKVLDIEWNVTRMGFVKPVILIEPTEIMGVTVSRVAGFNYEYIENSKIGKNSIIGVVRSGDVVPYVTEIFDSSKIEDMVIPKYCPTCNSQLHIISKELICSNKECKYKNIQKVAYFFVTMGCEGMSDKTIENLGITSIPEMYDLTQNYIEKLPGFGEKKAEKILSEVKKTLKVKPEKLLEAFGIPMIGKTLSKELCNKFSFDKLFEIKDIDELGLGEITSKTFIDNIQKYKELYSYLKSIGLEFIEEKNKEGSLKGFSFELTGKGPLGRDEIALLIEAKGGQVSSISKTTTYLVTNDINSKSSKMKKAEKLLIPIITYDKLFEEFLC